MFKKLFVTKMARVVAFLFIENMNANMSKLISAINVHLVFYVVDLKLSQHLGSF